MKEDANKTKAVDMAVSQIERLFGKGSIMKLGEKPIAADKAVQIYADKMVPYHTDEDRTRMLDSFCTVCPTTKRSTPADDRSRGISASPRASLHSP